MLNSEEKNLTNIESFTRNVFIIWKDEYNLGIPIIDEQHRGIVTIINSLHFGISNNYISDMLVPIIDTIYNYTDIHFRIEEDCLAKNNYPNVKGHHELHEVLTVTLTNIGKSSAYYKDPYQFLDFLKKWWINHIREEDLIYRNYLIPQ